MADDDVRHPASRRDEVLRTLKEAAGPLSIAEIAEALEVHPNTVRFHLDKLVERGQVERGRADRRVPGRPAQVFRAAPGMDPAGPRHYRLLAEALTRGLAAAPDSRARAIEAGRAWGLRSASGADAAAGADDALERLAALLDELGFAPQRQGGAQIGLRHCPFLELAASGSPIVCQIHLGLMRGALEAWRSPVTVDRLEAFAEPDRCLAHTAPH
ncbi:helix-turn-helix transcriptional regulator [Glycomyces arizonensis]|uniref:helix-turn-helix transcriptional regulator n=1 Tax=Glycomyces arizonensis TaxID=256035 RepID=UPI000479CB73|nr:helix-turn-helix domain-containing protein [Glycomyces arizonensis]